MGTVLFTGQAAAVTKIKRMIGGTWHPPGRACQSALRAGTLPRLRNLRLSAGRGPAGLPVGTYEKEGRG